MNNTTQINTIKDIAESYAPKTEQQSKFEELTVLDTKVRRPAEIFAYSFGCAGSLVLGAGMCLAMGVIGTGAGWVMPVGIIVGLVGIAAVSANYFIYKAIIKRRKAKYAKRILSLSDELLNK